MKPITFQSRKPGSGVARRVVIRLSLVCLLLGQLAFVAHGLHFDTDDSHNSGVCAICVASANLDSNHNSPVQLPVDPSFFVEYRQLPVDKRLVDSTRPLDLSARSPPLT